MMRIGLKEENTIKPLKIYKELIELKKQILLIKLLNSSSKEFNTKIGLF